MTRYWTSLIIGFGISLAGISAISAPAHAQDVRNRCSNDLSTQCGSAAGPRERLECLVENKDSLSSDCQAAVQEMMDKRAQQGQPAAN